MTTAQLRYIAVETGISVIINVVISAIFMELVFGRATYLAIWGAGGLAIDFIPQTFMISAMSVLVPTLLTRRRLHNGIVEARPPTIFITAPRSVWKRCVIVGILMTIVAGGLATAVLSIARAAPVTFWNIFPYKLRFDSHAACCAQSALRLRDDAPCFAAPQTD